LPSSPTTVDPASLDRFRQELRAAGFHSEDGGRTWAGPIFEALRDLTEAARMTLVILDGWPHRQPALRMSGLRRPEHATADGTICLWQDGDGSRQWMTLAGWRERVAEWRARQADGFDEADTVMDAHAYFEERIDGIATVDLDQLIGDAGDAGDGADGRVAGRWQNHGVLALTADHGKQDLKGLWFYRAALPTPPTNLTALRASLTAEQRTRYDQRIKNLTAGGGQTLFVLIWGVDQQRNAIVVIASRTKAKGKAARPLRARAIEVAFTDRNTLRRRCGTDAIALAGYRVAIFGVGAVGSQLAIGLADTGVGELTLIDGDRVRPGNVIRHRAGPGHVGMRKVEAIESIITLRAPWAHVDPRPVSVWNPDEIAAIAEDHDLVIDCTGNVGFGVQLAQLATGTDTPILVAALYRNGAISRVSRQRRDDLPLAQRTAATGYSEIPKGDDEPLAAEAGCSALVNLAPPPAVTECAALAVQVAVDTLLARGQAPAEIVTVHRPLDHAPFDRMGRLVHG
jgi:molybdopterin/thiamine biosynthesis adenylyltransferase